MINKTKSKRRILCSVLSLALILGMVPYTGVNTLLAQESLPEAVTDKKVSEETPPIISEEEETGIVPEESLVQSEADSIVPQKIEDPKALANTEVQNIEVPEIMPATIGDNFTLDGIKYSVLSEGASNEVAVTGNDGSPTSLPATVVNGGITYKVVTINSAAFLVCTSLIEVDLSNVTTIKRQAFRGCSNLTLKPGTNINPSLTTIEAETFWNCSKLTGLDLSNITTIALTAFQGCTSLTAVDISKATAIGTNAFNGCSNLTFKAGTNLNPNLTTISDRAFINCASLTGVDLSNVTTIGVSAFSGCTSLEEIDLSNVTSLGGHAFDSSGNIRLKDGTNLNPNLTTISSHAFYACNKIDNIDLSNVTIIEERAFAYGESLKGLDLSNITDIGNNAFLFCRNLKAIALPTTKPTIASDAFASTPGIMVLIDGGVPYSDLTGLPANSTYPSISGNTALATGNTLSLAIAPNAGDIMQYAWFKDGGSITGGTNATYGKTNMQMTDGGTYACDVTLGNVTNRVQTTVAVTIQTPAISVQPADASYTAMDVATALSVTANVTDGGTLSYQWYKNTVDSITGGTSIAGATNATYTPSTATAETLYYYCVVTNTNSGTSNMTSATAEVIVTLQTPVISVQPADASYTAMDVATALSVTANVTDGGTLTYQWYENNQDNTTGGTPITGATNATYTPDTSVVDTFYYYCVVTNTNNGAAEVTSDVVEIMVTLQTPDITVQPADATYKAMDVATPLSVEANVTDGGTLTYQWYENDQDNITGGTLITDATDATYLPDTSAVNAFYYYCVVTNTNNGTAEATSDVVEIMVEPTEYAMLESFGTWTGTGDLTGRVDADYEYFVREVYVNGYLIDSAHYTHSEGSTVITLKESYLKTLENGDYEIMKQFTNGTATDTFTVKVAAVETDGGSTDDSKTPGSKGTVTKGSSMGSGPKTGDDSNLILWIGLAVIAGSCLVGIVLWKRKNRKI